MSIRSLPDLVKRHEDYRGKPYLDTEGHLTVGYGRNLDAHPISRDEAEVLLSRDLARAEKAAQRYTWFEGLDPVRQAVVVDMVYNLGAGGFRRFVKLRRALGRGLYAEAALEMLDSRWAKQVKSRATRLAGMMRRGVWPN